MKIFTKEQLKLLRDLIETYPESFIYQKGKMLSKEERNQLKEKINANLRHIVNKETSHLGKTCLG